MALKEDYKDAVFAGLRKYKMLDNGDGTVSPVDMTEYEAAGDKFGAKDVNAITKMVNCTGDAFDPGRDYEVGDYTIYDNTVWKFTTAHPAGEWDESHVEKTRILVEIAEQNKNFEALSEKMDADKIIIGAFLINFNGGIGYLPYNHYPEYEKEPICIAMMVGKQRYGMTVVPSNYKDGRIELYTNAAVNGNLYVSYFIGLRK